MGNMEKLNSWAFLEIPSLDGRDKGRVTLLPQVERELVSQTVRQRWTSPASLGFAKERMAYGHLFLCRPEKCK
jgi:hypothetical protein